MKTQLNWDAAGVITSVACAIHCAVLPLILTSFPLFGVNIIHNNFFEAGMIALAFIIGSFALYHGFRRHHHKSLPLFIFSAGFIFLVLKEIWTGYEILLLIPAVILILMAHFLNYRFCRKANHCHSSDCNH
ncbi:MAG TPA: MerC domain-containing protein [Chitinophagaceae bacterium]